MKISLRRWGVVVVLAIVLILSPVNPGISTNADANDNSYNTASSDDKYYKYDITVNGVSDNRGGEFIYKGKVPIGGRQKGTGSIKIPLLGSQEGHEKRAGTKGNAFKANCAYVAINAAYWRDGNTYLGEKVLDVIFYKHGDGWPEFKRESLISGSNVWEWTEELPNKSLFTDRVFNPDLYTKYTFVTRISFPETMVGGCNIDLSENITTEGRQFFEVFGVTLGYEEEEECEDLVLKYQNNNTTYWRGTVNPPTNPLFMETPPEITKDKLCLPARAVCGEVEADIGWNANTREVTITRREDGHKMIMKINSTTIRYEPSDLYDDVEEIAGPYINPKFDRTYVPFRILVNFLGFDNDHVFWNGSEKSVTIVYEDYECLFEIITTKKGGKVDIGKHKLKGKVKNYKIEVIDGRYYLVIEYENGYIEYLEVIVDKKDSTWDYQVKPVGGKRKYALKIGDTIIDLGDYKIDCEIESSKIVGPDANGKEYLIIKCKGDGYIIIPLVIYTHNKADYGKSGKVIKSPSGNNLKKIKTKDSKENEIEIYIYDNTIKNETNIEKFDIIQKYGDMWIVIVYKDGTTEEYTICKLSAENQKIVYVQCIIMKNLQ